MRHREEPTHSMTGRLVRETKAAVLLQDPQTGEEVWLPRSQIVEMEESGGDAPDYVDVIMTEWIAKQKGLI